MSGPTIEFLNLFNGRITCRSRPMEGVKFKVTLPQGVQVGDELSYSWQGYSAPNGGNPIPETAFSGEQVVTQTDIERGAEVTISDYFKYIKPIKDGSAIATCEINNDTSPETLVQVNLLNTSGQTCDEVGSS